MMKIFLILVISISGTTKKIIKENYYTPINNKDKIEKVLQEDPYSFIIDPFQDSLFTSERGPDIKIEKNSKDSTIYAPWAVVTEVYNQDEPFQVGDTIISIDDRLTRDMTEKEIKRKFFLSKIGTYLRITKRKNGRVATFYYKIKKKKFSQFRVIFLDSTPIYYLKIKEFSLTLLEEMPQIINHIKNGLELKVIPKSQKLIIDLRDNPGGYTLSAAKFLSYFLESDDPLWYEIDKYKKLKKITLKSIFGFLAQNNHPYFSLFTVVVLVNKNTASAAEIVTAALKNKGAIIMGETTYGKGVGQMKYKTPDGILYLTNFKWLTPKKKWIQKRGIKPDFIVSKLDQVFKLINKEGH